MTRMPHWWTPALVAICALAALAAPARAQDKKAAVREGFWIGVGLGWGSAGVSCSSCTNNERFGGAAATVALGGTLNKHMLLGGETNAWSRKESGVTETMGDVAAVLYYYPSTSGTFFVKGGLGYVVYQADTDPKLETGGFGVSVGVGMDLYLGRTFSLTPYANFVTALGGTVKIGGTDTGFEARPNLIQLGVAAVWH